MCARPVWITVGGHSACDVEQVLHGEAESGEASAVERWTFQVRARYEGPYGVVECDHLLCSTRRLCHKSCVVSCSARAAGAPSRIWWQLVNLIGHTAHRLPGGDAPVAGGWCQTE